MALWPLQTRRGESANYQPLPWIGLDKARRCDGTPERWALIETHWCKGHGFAAARAGLGTLLARGRRVFFEMGQAEMAPKYNIPDFGGDAADWLRNLLAGLTDKPVVRLGETTVEAAYGREAAGRHLFCVG